MRKIKMQERKLIWRIVRMMPDDIVLMTDEERLDLLIDLNEDERKHLIEFCSRIIATATLGKEIKIKQLKERYADQLKH